MTNWLAIVNPRSGQYRSSDFETQWMPELEKYAAEIVITRRPGEASEIARAAKAYDGLIVVGGDGSIIEAIAGMHRDSQRLFIIPTGRGNCLARDLRIKSIAEGFDALQNGSGKVMDLLQVDIGFADGSKSRQYSASTIALGYVVAVVQRASRIPVARQHAYALATVVTRPKAFDCMLGSDDGDPAERRCTGFVANNTMHLANFRAFGRAAIDDGLFDTLLLDAGWLRQTLHNLSILSGTGLYEPAERGQATRVSVSPKLPQTLMIDGQLFSDVIHLTIECIPGAIVCTAPI